MWGQHSPAFKTGKLTLAAHTADVGDILTKANLWEACDSALETVRDARDKLDTDVKSLCVHGPDAIEGDLEEGEELLDDLDPIRAIRMTNPQKSLERGRKLVPAWTKANLRRTTAVPPDPELKAKGMTLAQFQTKMADLTTVLQTVETKVSDERNAPAPTALQIETVTPAAGGSFAVDYTAGGGAHASALPLQWQVVGVDADFGHDTAVNPAGQTVATGASAGATVKFRTKATNSVGATYSTVKTGTAQ